MGVYNEYWETDEFEDLVARSIIGLYETKIKKTKKAPKCVRFDKETYSRFRKMGCYFAPGDRICKINYKDDITASFTQEIDILNDGIPDKAIWTMKQSSEDSYLRTIYLERIPFLPRPFESEIKGKYFKIMQLMFTNEYVYGDGTLIVIDKEGKLQSCYAHDFCQDPITNRITYFKNRPHLESAVKGNCEDYFSVWGAFAIQVYQDRRHLWNVQAYEGVAKATFGVYPEQIKSLFYARSLPQTDTGRKRPILHWVASHQRRMKSGTEVDIEKYLRGTHEFEMNGTKFKIVNPLKNIKKD